METRSSGAFSLELDMCCHVLNSSEFCEINIKSIISVRHFLGKPREVHIDLLRVSLLSLKSVAAPAMICPHKMSPTKLTLEFSPHGEVLKRGPAGTFEKWLDRALVMD